MADPAPLQTIPPTPRRHLGLPSLLEGQAVDSERYRENLRLESIPAGSETARREQLARLLRDTEGQGIVYLSTVKACDEVVAELAAADFAVARFHGRLGVRERQANQDRFMAGELKAIVATNAFGMGIDKADIRFVIHAAMPGSLESYHQEASRAGGDGLPARCVLLHRADDRNTQVFFINGSYPKVEHFRSVQGALLKLASDGPMALGELREAAGRVPRTKLSVILDALVEAGFAAEPEHGSFRLTHRATVAELEELASRYVEKAEADRERLKRMVSYAQTALCRWKALLGYFGEEVEWDRCGHCDNCSQPVRELAAPRAEKPVSLVSEVLPLPPLVGDQHLAGLVAGDVVTLTIYGRGEVRAVDGDTLTIALHDGETRRFRRR